MKWISVKEALPEEGLRVLTFCKDSRYIKDYKIDYIIEFKHNPSGFIWACTLDDEMDKVSHWMLLPLPPIDVSDYIDKVTETL